MCRLNVFWSVISVGPWHGAGDALREINSGCGVHHSVPAEDILALLDSLGISNILCGSAEYALLPFL